MSDDVKDKQFELALKQAHNESQIVWQYSQAFILANTIIIGFVTQNIKDGNSQANLLLAIGGLILSTVWLGSSERRWGWFVFRMAQVNEAEKSTRFRLTGEDTGLKYSNGEAVIVGNKCYRLNWLARLFKTQPSTRIFIILFLLFYAAIILQSVSSSL